jgi:hypothetical protein
MYRISRSALAASLGLAVAADWPLAEGRALDRAGETFCHPIVTKAADGGRHAHFRLACLFPVSQIL